MVFSILRVVIPQLLINALPETMKLSVSILLLPLALYFLLLATLVTDGIVLETSMVLLNFMTASFSEVCFNRIVLF